MTSLPARRALAFALLVALALLLPTATAHLQGARPILQRGQFERLSELDVDGLLIDVDLLQTNDPLRHPVRHVLDPSRGAFYVEHREDLSDASAASWARWELERIIEYRDLNVDGRFQAGRDTAVKAWRFQHYQWKLSAQQSVQVGDVIGTSIVWEANLTGAPDIRIEAVFAGKDFTDEGAVTRPQDVLLYIDVLDLPPRGIGSLFAIEGRVTTPEATQLAFHRVDGVPTAVLADSPGRRALLVWGGEGLLDGREQRLDASLGEPTVSEGRKVTPFTLHVPTTDESMRFVVLTGFEYGTTSARAPWPGALTFAALALCAWLVARRR